MTKIGGGISGGDCIIADADADADTEEKSCHTGGTQNGWRQEASRPFAQGVGSAPVIPHGPGSSFGETLCSQARSCLTGMRRLCVAIIGWVVACA